MDIAALSIAMSTNQVQQEVGVRLAAEVLDNAEIQGDALVKMMEKSVSPELGQVVDVKL